MEPIRTLYVDCPWRFSDNLPGKSRGASKNYKTLTIDELKSFPLPPLADDCFLFFWRVSAMVPEAYEVINAWGFTAKSELIWRKITKHGKLHFGMGRITRASTETCIIATRGKPKRLSASVRNIFDAPVGQHSEKPLVMYDIIEQLAPGPYAELFSRRDSRPGWSFYGDQVGSLGKAA